MKTMKKAFALLLAVVMVMGLSVTAFAAGTGSITVQNADTTKEYVAYKIFDVTYTEDQSGYAYSISKDSAWLSVVQAYIGQTDDEGNAIDKGLTLTKSADGNNYVVAITNVFSAADFAEYLKQNIPSSESGTKLTNNVEAGTATATGLDLGYYFVTSSLGSLANLTTTEPNAVIYDKNEQPPFEKEADDVDVEIGQTVNYTITGEVPSTTGYTKYDYKVSDTLSSGLTFNKDVKVKFDGTEITLSTVTAGDDGTYTLTDGSIYYTNNGFELYFDMTKHQSDVDDVITITYSAVVNENAVVTTAGNPNNATLEYSNDPNDTTSTDEENVIVKVYTVDLTIDKYAGGKTTTDDEGNETVDKSTKLSGAKFVLVKKVTNDDGSTTEYFYKYTEATDTTPASVSWVTDVNDATVKTTNDSGAATFDGLEQGTYYLRETEAPAGYNLLTSDQEVTITRTETEGDTGTTVTITGDTAEVINNAGSELPSTGGIGTTIFYVVGSILVIGAAILLITKKRMSNVQ